MTHESRAQGAILAVKQARTAKLVHQSAQRVQPTTTPPRSMPMAKQLPSRQLRSIRAGLAPTPWPPRRAAQALLQVITATTRFLCSRVQVAPFQLVRPLFAHLHLLAVLFLVHLHRVRSHVQLALLPPALDKPFAPFAAPERQQFRAALFVLYAPRVNFLLLVQRLAFNVQRAASPLLKEHLRV